MAEACDAAPASVVGCGGVVWGCGRWRAAPAKSLSGPRTLSPNPASRTRPQPAIDHYGVRCVNLSRQQHLRNALFDALHQLSGTHYRKLFSVVTLLQFLSLGLKHSSSFRLSLFSLLTNTLPGPSASEVTTLRRYTNLFIIIIIFKPTSTKPVGS